MPKRLFYSGAVLLVLFIALGTRLYATQKLDIDFDEPVYLTDAIAYANFIKTGQFKMVAWYEKTYEHPSFYKVLYGAALLTQPAIDELKRGELPIRGPIQTAEARQWNMTDRYVSVFFGTLAVAALTIINPLAGFFLAVGTLSIKYTSEVYLEAFPLLASLMSALLYLRWFKSVRKTSSFSGRNSFYLIFSAIFLGLTAASKYVYCVVAIAIAVHFMLGLLQKQIPRRAFIWLMAWGVFSLLMFFAFDPYLWVHPFDRLLKTIQFHIGFQTSKFVTAVHYPFWQPLIWLSNPSAFYDLKPKSAFLVDIDLLIFIFALIGLPRLFKQRRFFFYWLGIGLFFLLIWTTKWPQYVLIIIVPFTLAASEGVMTIWHLIFKHRTSSVNKLELKDVQ